MPLRCNGFCTGLIFIAWEPHLIADPSAGEHFFGKLRFEILHILSHSQMKRADIGFG